MDILIDKCLREQLKKDNDFSTWLNLMKLIEHEIPFFPESRALKYFEAEHQILEHFFTFLALNPELDGH